MLETEVNSRIAELEQSLKQSREALAPVKRP